MDEATDIRQGDCREVMSAMPDNSVDAIVTDPPYALTNRVADVPACNECGRQCGGADQVDVGDPCPRCGALLVSRRTMTGAGFMGKDWDTGIVAFSPEIWIEALRVAKPGAHLLAFGGTRTYHRLACAIEDAGWEIRDCVMWCYGQGFPKSADVSKMLDKHEQKQWLDVSKAIDNMPKSAIIEAWKEHLKTASDAGLSFAKSETATGMNTPKSGFVPASALLQANPKNSDAVAVLAELSLIEACHTSEAETSSVATLADENESQSPARSVESRPKNGQAVFLPTGTVQCAVRDWQSGNTVNKLKAVEALKIWLGSKPSSRQEATSALCVALTDDLKRIILSQSKTFQNYDTTRQTACASAISATITESTAESLISFTVDTLRRKAIDKAAGAEREIIGIGDAPRASRSRLFGQGAVQDINIDTRTITAPATDAARKWAGWGTALKPAVEPIVLARKPLDNCTVAHNVLTHGTGAINVDGCRVGTADDMNARDFDDSRRSAPKFSGTFNGGKEGQYRNRSGIVPNGRWPANLILTYPEDQYILRDDVKPEQLHKLAEWMNENAKR